jgi:hypothetical protein
MMNAPARTTELIRPSRLFGVGRPGCRPTVVRAAKVVTFEQMCERFIAGHEAGWRNLKHRQQWRNTLKTYVYPIIGAVPVQGIDTGLAMKVVEPIWTKLPETGSRVRGRCEQVWDAAKAQKLCSGENPFDWKTLKHLLPTKTRMHKVKHHAAVPYRELPMLLKKSASAEQHQRRGVGIYDLDGREEQRGPRGTAVRI